MGLWYIIPFKKAVQSYPEKFAYLENFSEHMEHRIHAGADICLSPSRFEPCGLNPLYAMCYGSVPVVRATGGLCDTIIDAEPAQIEAGKGNGITFKNADGAGLLGGIERALRLFQNKPLWQKLKRNAMNSSFLWQRAASEYREIYADVCDRKPEFDIVTEVELLSAENAEIPFAPLLNVVG